jgi:hypothetical protein
MIPSIVSMSNPLSKHLIRSIAGGCNLKRTLRGALSAAMVLFFTGFVSSMDAQVTVATLVDQVSQANYQNYLDNVLYTHNGDNRGGEGASHNPAMTNILNELIRFGLQTQLEPFTYNETTWYNVVSVLPGKTARSNEVYLVSAHYDSVDNPGADDDGSGVAALLEVARILATNSFEATLVFAAFGQEETGLYGSKAYVDAHGSSNIRGMISLDMIAFSGGTNVVDLCGNSNSMALILAISNAVATYSGGLTPVYGGPEENADIYSFEAVGTPSCLMFEGGKNQYYHSAQDSVDTAGYIDYLYATRITRSALGFLATQAGLQGSTNPPTTNDVRLLTPVCLPDGTFKFNVSGQNGKKYVAQFSTNLIDWVDMGSYTGADVPFEVTDNDAPNFTQRYYRTREE